MAGLGPVSPAAPETTVALYGGAPRFAGPAEWRLEAMPIPAPIIATDAAAARGAAHRLAFRARVAAGRAAPCRPFLAIVCSQAASPRPG